MLNGIEYTHDILPKTTKTNDLIDIVCVGELCKIDFVKLIPVKIVF